jgi:hypothetical protein
MIRAVLVSAPFLAALAACNAQITEMCVSGPCTLDTGGGPGSTTGAGGAMDAANCPETPQTGDFPCDVFAVVHKSCNPCHQMPPKNGAPFPLLAYADTQTPYSATRLVFQQMFISVGPNGCPRMPFGGMLGSADYDTLYTWLGKCAPPALAGMGCGCTGGSDDAGPGCN